MPRAIDSGDDDEETARARRLALVIAAQFPGEPQKALAVLKHVNSLVHAYAGGPHCEDCSGATGTCWFAPIVTFRAANR